MLPNQHLPRAQLTRGLRRNKDPYCSGQIILLKKASDSCWDILTFSGDSTRLIPQVKDKLCACPLHIITLSRLGTASGVIIVSLDVRKCDVLRLSI